MLARGDAPARMAGEPLNEKLTHESTLMDDRTLLAAIGEALFGPRWQADISRELKVSDRSVRKWIADNKVPDGVWRDLSVLLADRREVIDSLLIAVRDRS